MSKAVERRQAVVFKPAIDAAMARIAKVGGKEAEAKGALGARSAEGDAWSYFVQALDAVKDLGLAEVAPPGTWGDYFFSGRHRDYTPHTTQRGKGNWLVMEEYPPEAQPALKEGRYVGGYDADVVMLWTRADGRQSVCHAHPEGFWVLGQDAIDFVERTAAQVEGRELPNIVDDEVNALAGGKPRANETYDDE